VKFQKTKKTEFSSYDNTSSLKISSKSIESFLRNRRHKKKGKRIIRIRINRRITRRSSVENGRP
jgi:hypothetical protein